MKKLILILLVLSPALSVFTQVSVPNGGFELWTATTYSYPANYLGNSNNDNDGFINVRKAVGYTGNYGVELETILNDGVRMGYFMTVEAQGDDPFLWHGGIPYTEIPTGFQGYYKYNRASGDNGFMLIAFSKNGVNLRTYFFNLDGLHTDYTPFNFTLEPVLTTAPDSVIVAFASSNMEDGLVGSKLVVDNVSFTGVISQPALLSGDFEEWTDVTKETLDEWHAETERGVVSVKKTTDAYKGDYAVELKTYLGEKNNLPVARSASLMSGYYPDCDGGDCPPAGGQPFTNQTDVLEFYYKYIPQGSDYANVGLYFKKTGGPHDWLAGMSLSPASEFTYVEIPVNLFFEPDSVIIQIQSSANWESTSLANVGSTLIIDDMGFRSQKYTLSKTVVATPGALSALLSAGELNTITHLTVTGNIDARDFKTMRDLMPVLANVDISAAAVMSYSGTAGTVNSVDLVYPANTIPRNGMLAKTTLKNIQLPLGLTAIGRSAFNRCDKLTSITIPPTVTVIDTMAFRSCKALTDIAIPSSVTKINQSAFLLSGLKTISLAEGLEVIGNYAFQSCDSLQFLSIPSTVRSIGYCAITFVNSLQGISVPTSNQHYAAINGVLYDKSMQRLIAYPPLRSMHYDIPHGVTVIDTAAFEGNWRLRSVVIPATVTEIAPEAFYMCNMLSAIDIPASVADIGEFAFYNCQGLSAVFVNTLTPLVTNASDSIFKYINAGCTLYVPVGSAAAYQYDHGWNTYINRIKEFELVTDVEGNVYHAVQIGTQKWLVENLRTKHYNNTEAILTSPNPFADLSFDNMAKYNWAAGNNEANNYLYGRLYTWNVLEDARGICPTGWKIPTRTEWETLFTYAAGAYTTSINKSLAASSAWATQGDQIYNTPAYNQPMNNQSGFMAFPAGVRQTNGGFVGYWGTTYFWTSEKLDNYVAYGYNIDYNKVYMNSGLLQRQEGFSVRCVKSDVGTRTELLTDKELKIYPNPTENGFYLPENVAVSEIVISDLQGAVVLKIADFDNYVSISTLASGLYVLQLRTEEGVFKTKLLKK